MSLSSVAAMSRVSSAGISHLDRLYAAAAYAGFGGSLKSINSSKYSNDTALLLYALYQQAVFGPCNVLKPRGWSPY